jgi:BioD-like phosphotransacetylase family protein
MSDDTSSSPSPAAAVPFPTLTILYLPSEAKAVVDEVSQKYSNSTVEDCVGFFHGTQRHYKKVTMWSQGIDSLWLNAIVARTKELAGVEYVTLVSGGMMYVL